MRRILSLFVVFSFFAVIILSFQNCGSKFAAHQGFSSSSEVGGLITGGGSGGGSPNPSFLDLPSQLSSTSGLLAELFSGSAYASFPDIIVCEASDNRYEIVYLRSIGSAGHIAYQNIDTDIAFDTNGNMVRASGNTSAFSDSNCRVGTNISSLKAYKLTRSSSPVLATNSTADVLVCLGPNDNSNISGHRLVEILYNRVKGTSGNIAYENPGSMVRFNSSGQLLDVTGSSRALSLSDCSSANFSSLQKYNLETGGSPIINGFPDAVECQASNNKYEVVFNRVRGNGGNVAYTNQGTFVRFNSSGGFSDSNGTTTAFNESDCRSNSLSSLRGINFRKTLVD